MAELKTKLTDESVAAFLGKVEDPARRADCEAVLAMMQQATGCEPRMWGASIVGFGKYKYTYATGRSGEWMVTGFSPRKHDLTLYIMPGFTRYDALMARLGKHKTGKSCLYLKRLADVDTAVLQELIAASVKAMAKQRVE
jgi:hypothetical protein